MASNRDPVCGMQLTPGQIEAQSMYAGTAYNFCSTECKRQFDANPKQYVGGEFDQPEDSTTPSTSREQ